MNGRWPSPARAGRRATDQATGWRQVLRQRWQAQPRRQQVLLVVAAGLVAGTLFWRLALAPALSTLREAPQQQRVLDAQLARMQSLEAQARTLRQLPTAGRDDARRALEASVQQQLGPTARLQVSGERATLTLTGARGESLAQWLAQARIDARTRPVDARLTRNAAGLWDGNLTLALPAR